MHMKYQCPLYRAFLITTVKKDFWGKDDDLVLKQVSMPSISGFPHYIDIRPERGQQY